MQRWALGFVCALAIAACGEHHAGGPRQRLRLATTTSTHNSGLLDDLLRPFERREHCEVQILAVGTGQALKLGERGDADVVLVHARQRELAFVKAGHGVDRREVMYNDFVLAGPADDPAQVGGLKIAAALRRLVRNGGRFVSRGDDSGTHIRELELWQQAGITPPTQDTAQYFSPGQGMGACLIMADEKHAYVLTDRGTYLAFQKKIDLVVLVEGDDTMRNPYGAMLVNPKRHSHIDGKLGTKLLDYLTSTEGRDRIRAFRVDGQQLFFPSVRK